MFPLLFVCCVVVFVQHIGSVAYWLECPLTGPKVRGSNLHAAKLFFPSVFVFCTFSLLAAALGTLFFPCWRRRYSNASVQIRKSRPFKGNAIAGKIAYKEISVLILVGLLMGYVFTCTQHFSNCRVVASMLTVN